MTTTSAPAMLAAACPSNMIAPRAGKPLRDCRISQVGAGNLVAEIQQHLGNAAHADAADAYEMYTLNFGEHEINDDRRISPPRRREPPRKP